jgi:predicted phosphodiesterase
MIKSIIILLFLTFFSCKEKSTFHHQIPEGPKPWTHDQFDTSNDKFTFALFSDLTGNEREGIFNVAVAQLNLLRPDMIINVGDLIEGDHENIAELHEQWDSFDARAAKAKAPVFYVGGNHDLTGVDMWQVWDERYGQRYYHFIFKDVLFLVLNTEDNTPKRMDEITQIRARALARVKEEGWGVFSQTEYSKIHEQKAGNIGAEQSAYFQKVINENPKVLHTFLFMHKAPWKKEGEENFSAIEKAMSDRPYTVFNGHVHSYEHEERLGRDYIRLATTGGVQLPENGRSVDHVTLVTVDRNGVDIANLLMAGILDKTGKIPIGGDTLVFEKTVEPLAE